MSLNGHRIQMPGMPPAAPQVQIASPLNDIQLLALVASQLPAGTPKERVGDAIEIVAHAAVLFRQGSLAKAMERIETE